MAWLESHQSLQRHPKTIRAARQLGVPRVHLIGHLHALWWWCLDYAADGDVSAFDTAELAAAAEWDGDPDAFVGALRAAGFIEPDHRIHDWDDYAGKLVQRREANARRMREVRATPLPPTTNARAPHVQRTEDARAEHRAVHVQSESTNQQDQTEPTGEHGARAYVRAEAVATAEVLVLAPFVSDDVATIALRVDRAFAAVPEFDQRAGPCLADQFIHHAAYLAEPPRDWSRAWLRWLRVEARSAEAVLQQDARTLQPTRLTPAERDTRRLFRGYDADGHAQWEYID